MTTRAVSGSGDAGAAAREPFIPLGSETQPSTSGRPPSPTALSGPSSAATVAAQPAATCAFAACARPEVAEALPSSYADVGQWTMAPEHLPVVYSERYNITFFGIEKLHPFDSCKFRRVLRSLEADGVLRRGQTVCPVEASLALLHDVHDPDYVNAFHYNNWKIVKVTELPPLLLLPNFLLRTKVVGPMKTHVAGTVLAAGLAVKHGWAINVGGGMHHAFSGDGMGWCPFDDIYLAIRRLRAASNGAIQRVLLIDLDAHQGNGIERDKLFFGDQDLFILDVYNSWVFPRDDKAKAAIDVAVELKPGAEGGEYLRRLEAALKEASSRFPRPDLIVFNAGTDVLEGDPLGRLAVSADDVVARDERVWAHALAEGAPLVMTLSGGYSPASAPVIARSISNLFRRFGLNGEVVAGAAGEGAGEGGEGGEGVTAPAAVAAGEA